MLDGTDPSAGSQAERERWDIKTPHHLGPGRIVSIHDRGASGLRRLSEQLEQTTLRPTVLIERAMKIEMILCQVGEHGDVERQSLDAGKRQRVRGDLHRDRPDPVSVHACQH